MPGMSDASAVRGTEERRLGYARHPVPNRSEEPLDDAGHDRSQENFAADAAKLVHECVCVPPLEWQHPLAAPDDAVPMTKDEVRGQRHEEERQEPAEGQPATSAVTPAAREARDTVSLSRR